MTNPSYSRSRFAELYFTLQGVAIACWWWSLGRWPDLRGYFVAEGFPDAAFDAFLPPDVALGVLGSLAVAVVRWRGSAWALSLAWWVAGGMVYATLYCVGASLATDSAWWSVAFMLPAAFFSVVAAGDLGAGILPVFRRSRSATPGTHLAKTLLQIVVFWSFFLAILPWGILALEERLGIFALDFVGQRWIASLLFLACSALGLASGVTMAKLGDGTPLPVDGTNRLVIAGPYRYLRNPMVVAGLGQGLAVALFSGSWLLVGYVFTGGAIWQWLVRPAEEDDLLAKFGDDYTRYRREVRCWIPRRSAGRGRNAERWGR